MSILLVGMGGHARVVKEAIKREQAVDWCEVRIDTPLPPTPLFYHIAIGDNGVREMLARYLSKEWPKSGLLPLCHRSAVFEGLALGKGSFLAAGSYVGGGSMIYEGVIINSRASVDHDCQIGEFSHLAPGVVTGGWAKIGPRCFIGMGALIRDRINIGEGCTIGMGAVITKDVPAYCTAWGNPARIIKVGKQRE